ncbi:hypothetical protein [Streptomyces sp. NPDC020571]|uniref:hypothetical protein n=1 Tax=Streptomyces sp. NPDC020571 TaxID=3365079 RepID=UPI00379D6D92
MRNGRGKIHGLNGGEALLAGRRRLDPYEKQWDTERQLISYESTWRDVAWLPGTLLRRLGLLHTFAVPQVVTGREARVGEWWILQFEHDSDTGLRCAELVQALTDSHRGLPLELCGHRDLMPGDSLGLILLKSPDRAAAFQQRYDRIDYPIAKDRTEMFAAIRRRTGAFAGEAALPATPGGSATGGAGFRGTGPPSSPRHPKGCRSATTSHAPRACRTVFALRPPGKRGRAGSGRGRRWGGRGRTGDLE